MQDLASQRDTLVSQAEQVRSAINNVHIDLTQDLSTISELVGEQVNEAAQRITNSLAEKGEHITLSLGQIGDNMIQQLSERGGDLIERLESTSDETTRAIATASDRLTASLKFKTDHIGEEFSEIADGLEDMMTSRLDRVTEGFSEKSLAILDLMAVRSQELTDSSMTGRRPGDHRHHHRHLEPTSPRRSRPRRRGQQHAQGLRQVARPRSQSARQRVVTKLEQTGARITDTSSRAAPR